MCQEKTETEEERVLDEVDELFANIRCQNELLKKMEEQLTESMHTVPKNAIKGSISK